MCEIHKKVLGIGVILRDPVIRLRHPYANTSRQNRAIAKFLLEHSSCQCVILNDKDFWMENRAGYQRMDNAYGLPFKGPDVFTELDESSNAYVAQFKFNLEECDKENERC